MSGPAWRETIARLDSIGVGVDAMQARIEALKTENASLRAVLRDATNHCSRCYGNGWLRRLPGNDRVPCEQCQAWRDALGKAVAP